ncbi:hypothetical protein KDN32_15560 [Nocardioides sp. J2M5]|uniref:hypothetical protein n=1 Tax=Nocardioides palaemonis TaxID=2829810 RepID=UPI001BAA9142|nr:hypothetical protein [Nocardioides palaemonis]MBS2939157.1 hypothetical protein [Nocardioides palaemonis]
MTTARRTASLTLACAVVLVATACGDGTGDPGGGGSSEAMPAVGSADITGTDTYVQLPHGRVEVTVSDPATLDPDLVEDGAADGLADDQQVVGVDWEFVPSEGVPSDVTGFVIADDVPAEVTLTVGDDERVLGDAYTVAGSETTTTSVFVPVDDGTDLDDVTVAVDFDGADLAVDVGTGERTPADELYADVVDPDELACDPSLEPRTVTGQLACTVVTRPLAWVTGLGWAGDGEAWWIVDSYTGARDLRDAAGGRYVVTAMEDRSTVDGAAPDATLLEDFVAAESALRTQQVFAGEVGTPPLVSVARTLTWREEEAGSLGDGDELRLVADTGSG